VSQSVAISETLIEHLQGVILGSASSISDKVFLLLEAEYRRRLTRYGLTDRQLQQKYGMTFAEFESRRMTEQLDFSWEVESDAIAWDTAVDGMRTVERQLRELLDLGTDEP
jgi:hypothetical protein